MKLNSISLVIAGVLSASVLNSLAFADSADNSSGIAETIVLEVDVFFGGSALPDMRGKQRVYTRSDRRRIVNEYKPENWLVGKAIGQIQSDDIARLDKGVQWLLKPAEKSYIECPLAGCGARALAQEFKPDVENSPVVDDEENSVEANCVAEPSKNEFTVKATGERREVAGREAEKYKIDWVMEAKDPDGRIDHFEAEWTMWTTTPNQQMQAAWQIHENFQADLLTKMGEQGNVIAQVLPKEVYMSLAGFSGDIKNENEANGTSPFAREMRQIKGYPLSIKLELRGEQNACKPIADKKQAEAETDNDNPLDWFKKKANNFIADAATKSFKSSKHEPLIIYQYDVKNIKVSEESAELFDIPNGFILTARN